MRRRLVISGACSGCVGVALPGWAQQRPGLETRRADTRPVPLGQKDLHIVDAPAHARSFCGFDDGRVTGKVAGGGGLGPRSYSLKGAGRSDRSQLLWSFSGAVPGVANPMRQVQRACDAWSAAAPALGFAPVGPGTPQAAITISMGRLGAGTLGSTTFNGQSIVLNNAVAWTDDGFFNVVIHEIGHAIGLLHSTNPDSLMYPFGDASNLVLGDDDVSAVRALYGWSAQRRLAGGSEQTPALCLCGPTLVMAWRGTRRDNDIWIATSSDFGISWSPQRRIPGAATSSSPSLAWRGNTLYMAWKGVEGDTALYWAASTDAFVTTRFGIRRFGDRGSSHGPRIAPMPGGLMMVWKGIEGDQAIYASTWADTPALPPWSGQQQVPGVGTSAAPALCPDVAPGMRMVWKGIEGDTGLYTTTFTDNFWQPQQQLGWIEPKNGALANGLGHPGSADGPSVVRLPGKVIAIWRGIPGDQNLYYTQLAMDCLGAKPPACTGGRRVPQWSQQARIPDTGSSHAPAVVAAGPSIRAVWKGIEGDNALYTATV